MFFMRVGFTELLLCAALFVGLILIPLLLYWKSQRMGKDK
jgi:hypothetical protein